MLSSGDMDSLVKQIINQLGQVKDTPSREFDRAGQAGDSAADCIGSNTSSSDTKIPLKAQTILVLLGLIGGILEVHSVLVDTDQNVEILLIGSLKRPTRLDKRLDIIGNMPFDDVLKAIMNRLG
jgi:hypothetical protein